MHQNTRLQDFMIFPFAIIILDNGREILPEVPWTEVRKPVFHWFVRIK
jgi:hypothetical protein